MPLTNAVGGRQFGVDHVVQGAVLGRRPSVDDQVAVRAVGQHHKTVRVSGDNLHSSFADIAPLPVVCEMRNDGTNEIK